MLQYGIVVLVGFLVASQLQNTYMILPENQLHLHRDPPPKSSTKTIGKIMQNPVWFGEFTSRYIYIVIYIYIILRLLRFSVFSFVDKPMSGISIESMVTLKTVLLLTIWLPPLMCQSPMPPPGLGKPKEAVALGTQDGFFREKCRLVTPVIGVITPVT